MGFRFRKSINLGGGFKVNLSKSGVGYSFGTKGFRVTKKAKGGTRYTASIPGTGISYSTETSGKKRSRSNAENIQKCNSSTHPLFYKKEAENNTYSIDWHGCGSVMQVFAVMCAFAFGVPGLVMGNFLLLIVAVIVAFALWKLGSSWIKRDISPSETATEIESNSMDDETMSNHGSPDSNDSKNNNGSNSGNQQSPQNKNNIIRWIVGGIFTMFAIVNGFHYSSLFLLAAAFLMFPFPFVESHLQKLNVKTGVAIVLSIVLFCVGALTSPPTEATDNSNQGGNSEGGADSGEADRYSNLNLFIAEYNKVAKTDITSIIEIDIQSPEYYRSEFRLQSFKNVPAYKGNLGDNTIEIINVDYNYRWLLGSTLRIYAFVDTIEETKDVFEAFCKSCDPSITQEDFEQFYAYNSFNNKYSSSFTLKGITGYVHKETNGFDIMINADPDYFD